MGILHRAKAGAARHQLRRGDEAELLIPNQNFFTQEAGRTPLGNLTPRRGDGWSGLSPRTQTGDCNLGRWPASTVLQYPPPAAFTVDFADSSINYKLLFWVRNPLEAFGVGSDLRQAIWTAFEENGIGIPFPQRQVYPMEWPPSKDQTLRIGATANQLQVEDATPEDQPSSTGEAT